MARKILVVEDSPTQAERVRLLLEEAGYDVELARNGREGLRRVQFALPDLIISDVMMPEMDGYAFCHAVKSVEATRRLPFVLLTGRNTPADILFGLEQGADNFITKPFEDDYLLERVQQIFAHLELRQQGHVEAELPMRVGGREMAISADKQQIVELLLTTFVDLRTARDKLEQTNTELLRLTLELEDRVAQRTAELQQAYDDLRQTQQVVMQQERLRALGQMASGIAHDINNAISPITLYVESLLANEPTLSVRAREYLTTVQQAANDVAHTVARLQEFYRQPVGLQEALPVDLNQIVPQVVELTRAKWRDEPQRLGVTITVHTALQEEGLPLILGVESGLREALINLIFNAVDAMPYGGRLTLRTLATPTAVVVEVSDTGMGMDEVTRQRCLEPFYTTKNERGTGLGLAMVYGTTKRHAAQISIESAVGQGTTVRLLFPVAPSQDERHDQPSEIEAGTHPLRILVVDDDPLIRKLLQDVLQAESHMVTVVEGGRIGLAAVQVARERQEPFDVVITDLGMPEMDGREVARGVKQAAPATPVIMLTGWGQALRQDDALPPHVDHLLSKPPGLQELRAALRAVARPAGKRADDGHN